MGSIKRAWIKPPSEVEKPRKPAMTTFAGQLGMLAFVVAVASATVAPIVVGGSHVLSTPELPINLVARVCGSGEKRP